MYFSNKEQDKNVMTKQSNPVKSKPKLHNFKDIPPYLRSNEAILKGYRVNLTCEECLKSILMWTNESLNIWTHLLGGLWFLITIAYDNFIYIPEINGSFQDHLIVTVFDICFALCMLLSAGYHTFSCHSERWYKKWLALDLAGISMSLVGMYISSFYYGFYCYSNLQYFYTVIVMLFLMVNTYLHTKPDFLHHSWSSRRTVLYCSLVLFGIIPASHWYVLLNGWSNSVIKMFVPKLIVMYLLGFLGVLLYISKLPERFYPGCFDYVGCSHQWWHVIVLCALLWYHHSAFTLIKYRVSGDCSNG
eukprot:gene16884-18590_t